MDEIAAVMKLMGSDPTESEIRDMVNQVCDYLIENNHCLNAPFTRMWSTYESYMVRHLMRPIHGFNVRERSIKTIS